MEPKPGYEVMCFAEKGKYICLHAKLLVTNFRNVFLVKNDIC